MQNTKSKKDRVYNLAYKFEQDYGGCAQCVLGAIKSEFNFVSDEVFKSASGLAGGLGLSGDTCGALLGGAMALSACYGREFNNLEDPNGIRYVSYKMVKELREKFLKYYGSTKCYDIQTQLLGREYNLWDEEEFKLFEEAGGHKDKCPSVCANAAQWTVEILEEENLL